MKTINYDKLMSIDMFSDWGLLEKDCRHLTKDSSDTDLADGFIKFVEIWLKDMGIDIDIYNPQEWKRKGQYFTDWETGEKYFYPGDLQDDLLTRWSDYVLRD